MIDPKKGSGRTTRLLRYAIQRMREDKSTVVFAINNAHAFRLAETVQVLLKEAGDEGLLEEYTHPVVVMSFDHAMSENRWTKSGWWTHYSYATNVFRPAPKEAEYLIDHAALEHHLAYVIGYLKALEPIKDPIQWMTDTARVNGYVLGRRVYFVTDDEQEREIAKETLGCYNVSVEAPSDLSNLDPVKLMLRPSHPNAQLLADPQMIQRMFAGALNEMKRWDE